MAIQEIVYDSTTCPNPEVVLVDALAQMAVATKAAICRSVTEANGYTDTKIAEVNTRLAAIDSQDTLGKINSLKGLVDSLDLNNDGQIVDNLLAIKKLADDAQAAADAAKSKADSAEGKASKASEDALACSQALASFQISISNSVANIESRVSALESEIVQINSEFTTISDSVSQLQSYVNTINITDAGLKADEARAIAQEEICKNNKKLAAGLSAAVLSWTATMEGPCPVSGN